MKEIPQQKLHKGNPESSLKLSWGESNSTTEDINTGEGNLLAEIAGVLHCSLISFKARRESYCHLV